MSLEKLRCPRFWLFSKTELPQTAQPAPWPSAESNCYIKDCTRWSVKFFPRNFSSCNFRIFSSQQKGLMLKVSWFMWETEFSLEKERTKGCFLLAHNLKSNKVSVRDKFLLDVQNAPPLWKVRSFAGFHKLISVANSHHKNKFCTTDNIWNSQFLSSYPVILFLQTLHILYRMKL